MGLIDAGELLNALEIVPLIGDGGVDINDLEELINNSPSIDAVPVVRCVDCVSYSSGVCYSMLGLFGQAKPMDFCSYGKRRA